jgi:tRNA nucleotidyltransferase (CCA-adding enzyme)
MTDERDGDADASAPADGSAAGSAPPDGNAFAKVVTEVRERVDPDPAERERLDEAVAALKRRTRDAVADLPVEGDAVEIVQVGSTARGTWIAGDRDVDLFVAFPPDVDRDALEEWGLAVGHAVLPDGHEEYAEHPYVKGAFDGFTVDLVPCYAVEAATDIQSAVDRTPFHTRYLTDRIDDALASEVRVTKQFLKGVGVYGSDLKTEGLSGYLTELLVVEYGGFRGLVEAAADWHPPVHLDPENHGRRSFDDPLVVIDPTDPERNVAAVCSQANVARLQHYARDLLSNPRESLFGPDEPDPLSAEAVRAALGRRGTTPVALRFEAPDVVDDQLYPQLDRSLSGVVGELDRRGFDVLRAAAFAADTVALFVELEIAERPTVERHGGPPVHVRDHAAGFYRKYADADAYGPFVDGDRYVVERDREYETARALLESDAVFEVALGKDIERVLADGYEVLLGDDVASLAAEFGRELAAYFNPQV